ncbi:MAG: trypsin-like peptidase domain-containing protein [Phycisphaerae bacterium]
MHTGLRVLVPGLLAAVLAATGCEPRQDAAPRAAPSYEMLRRTAVVEVFQACKESVVNIGCTRQDPSDPDVKHTEYASGVVVHPAGFVLTNAHLLRHEGDLAVGFDGGREYTARVVAFDEQLDLAVLRVDAQRRLKPITLGRSQGLMVGERVVTMGNPFGMGMTVAEGIVSAIGRSTKSEYTFYAEMIQTDATTNPGSSGGPLLNVSGEMVGLNTTKKLQADNIAFAIPADRIRESLPEVLAVEERRGFTVGLEVATLGPAEVTKVRQGSPAEAAGVRPGDVVTRLAGEDVPSGLSYHLALLDAEGGQPLLLRVLRGGRFLALTLTPKAEPLRPPELAADVEPGLERLAFEGTWERLPDFDTLEPAATDRVETFDLGPYAGKDGFALLFRGYVGVPADGVYAFYTESDDGSRLCIGDREVVSNDGTHPARRRRGFIPLRKGKHPIAVAYVETGGDEVLEVSWHGPGEARRPIPASALFRDAP